MKNFKLLIASVFSVFILSSVSSAQTVIGVMVGSTPTITANTATMIANVNASMLAENSITTNHNSVGFITNSNGDYILNFTGPGGYQTNFQCTILSNGDIAAEGKISCNSTCASPSGSCKIVNNACYSENCQDCLKTTTDYSQF